MNLELYNMTISDLNLISDTLFDKFDDFWTYNVFKSELENPNSMYIVAKFDDEIVGFAGIWKAYDDVHITNIVTRKDIRNQGIGSKLLEELINLAKKTNFKTLTLEVNENNNSAIHLYEKFGFSTVGVRKKYYNNIDNAIIMSMNIN